MKHDVLLTNGIHNILKTKSENKTGEIRKK